MKVFISWSGDRSRAVAELLDDWIQCVLQAVDPWLSSKDVDRGSLWFSEITDQLKDTNIGIVCLTKDNKNRPWILFESGALAKGLSSARVCTFLVDLEPTDIGNPMAQFNHTMPDRDGVFELVRTLNSVLGDQALREKILEKVFDTYWPQFESSFAKALEDNPTGESEPPRTEENMLIEVLRTVRSMDRRVRRLETPTAEIEEVRRSRFATSFKRVEEKIRKMIESGVPPEMVERMVKGDAPARLIKNIIAEAILVCASDDAVDGEEG